MLSKILLVDDEAEVVEIIQKRLSRDGFQVYGAADGQRALELSTRYIPDLIVTDVIMPVMNGFEFCKAVKQNNQTKEIPIIVVSAKGAMEDSLMYLGVNDFIHKPFNVEQLEMKIIERLYFAKTMQTLKTKMLFHSSKPAVFNSLRRVMEPVVQWAVSYAMGAKELVAAAKTMVPDIIVLDLLMVDCFVDEIIKELKQCPELANTDILVYYSPLSAANEDVSLQAKMIEIQYLKHVALQAGAREYLGPFSQDNIMHLLNSYRKDIDV